MRLLTLVLALMLCLAPAVGAQGTRISGPINKARSAAAAASARTERQQREGLAPQNVDTTPKPAVTGKTPTVTAGSPPAGKAPPATRPTASGQTANQVARPGSGTATAQPQGGAVAKQTTAAAVPAGRSPGATNGVASPPATAGKAPVPPAKASGTASGAPSGTRGVTPAARRPSTTVESARDTARTAAALAQPRPDVSISREVFQYDPAGRRDPFVSLLTTDDLRPLFTDLVLVGVAHDRNPRNSVAIMRDVKTKEQYRARVGQLVGRLRVSSIDRKQVVFTIEEFGFSRQETLVLGDTSKVRKQ
jgi:hypothetical protein